MQSQRWSTLGLSMGVLIIVAASLAALLFGHALDGGSRISDAASPTVALSADAIADLSVASLSQDVGSSDSELACEALCATVGAAGVVLVIPLLGMAVLPEHGITPLSAPIRSALAADGGRQQLGALLAGPRGTVLQV